MNVLNMTKFFLVFWNKVYIVSVIFPLKFGKSCSQFLLQFPVEKGSRLYMKLVIGLPLFKK